MKKIPKYLLIILFIIIAYMPLKANADFLCTFTNTPTDATVSACCSNVTSSGLCIGDAYNVLANSAGDLCLTTDVIKTKISDAYDDNRQYNCGNNTTPCKPGMVYCGAPDNNCFTPPANNCADLNRVVNCDGTCGGCKTNFSACSGTSGDYSCTANTYCTIPGKTTSDYCTGACSDCQAGFFTAPDGSCTDHPLYYDSTSSSFKGWIGTAWQVISGDIAAIVQEIIDNYLDELKEAMIQWDGLSTTTYSGKPGTGGYAQADAACSSYGEDSRVCTAEEIIALTQSGALDSINGQGWVNGGPPGYTVKANDCDGWKNNTNGALGRWWDFTNKAGWLDYCNVIGGHNFACCH